MILTSDLKLPSFYAYFSYTVTNGFIKEISSPFLIKLPRYLFTYRNGAAVAIII